jgi:hypothetical protein
MGSQKCRIVGKSQSVLIMINPIIFTRTRIHDAPGSGSVPPTARADSCSCVAEENKAEATNQLKALLVSCGRKRAIVLGVVQVGGLPAPARWRGYRCRR